MPPAAPPPRSLFRRWPALAGKLPWMQLAELPSPVQPLKKLGERVGAANLWIKRDDIDSPLYGGNKPRKFEFVFAEALALGRREIVTLGAAGSNHAAAVCLFSQSLHLQATLAVSPQPVLSYVRRNILVDHACGARFLVGDNDAGAFLKAAAYCVGPRLRGRKPPYFMYYGASSPTGNAGFVNAALELAEQIKAGELPMPRRVFTATGSCGTHAGLLVGFRAAGLPIEVVGVSVVPKILTNRHVVALHANRTARFLHGLDASFPAMHIRPADVNLLEDFVGGQYARPTPEGKAAIRLMKETEGLTLDPTYTGKAFAGMLSFIREKKLGDEPALFWLTLNSRPLDRWIPPNVPDDLPPALKRYFTEPLYDPEL